MVLTMGSGYNFHLVKVVALDVLSCPAGEAAAERIFSIASRLLGHVRHRLSPESLRMGVFLKKNRRHWEKTDFLWDFLK